LPTQIVLPRECVHRPNLIHCDVSSPATEARPILSSKEFGVLEALMRVSPAVLSAQDLLEQVWDENADLFTKTVQVTVVR
jgi:DNA-binding response OmpR family regulator